MWLDSALALRDGKEYLGDPVADVVFHQMPHEDASCQDPHDGEEQVGKVEIIPAEVFSEEYLEEMDGAL